MNTKALKKDFTFCMVNRRFKLPRRSANKLKRKYTYKGQSLAFYHPETRQIQLVRHPKRILIEYAQGMNFRISATLHRAGFHIKPKRSIKKREKILSGYRHIKDVGDMYSRIISHESIHKALDNIGELRACMEFDNLNV